MNKHELKSLLENIYTALTEAQAAPPQPEMIPWIPPYGFPVVPIQIPTTPVAPPKPNPRPPYYIPDPDDNENPWEPDESPLDRLLLRRLLSSLGISESEIEQIIN